MTKHVGCACVKPYGEKNAIGRRVGVSPLPGRTGSALERVGEGASRRWCGAPATSARGVLAALKVARAGRVAGRGRAQGSLPACPRRAALGPRAARRGAGVSGGRVDRRGRGRSCARVRGRERVASRVAHAVGRALDELHEAGVHHGDVKPGNVLLARDGSRHATRRSIGARRSSISGLAGRRRGASPRRDSAVCSARARTARRVGARGGPLGARRPARRDPRSAAAAAEDPRRVVASWDELGPSPARWVAGAPRGVARGTARAHRGSPTRAARWLGLRADEAEAGAGAGRSRAAHVPRRPRADVTSGARRPVEDHGPAREWLKTHALGARLGLRRAPRHRAPRAIAADDAARSGAVAGRPRRGRRGGVAALGDTLARGRARRRGGGARARRATRGVDDSRTLVGVGAAVERRWDPGEGDERSCASSRELSRPAPEARRRSTAPRTSSRPARHRAPSRSARCRALARGREPGARGLRWRARRAPMRTRSAPRSRGAAATSALRRSRGERAMARERDPRLARGRAATLARLAWDAAGSRRGRGALEGARGTGGRRGAGARSRGVAAPHERRARRAATARSPSRWRPTSHARLEAVRGLLELARGRVGAGARARSGARSSSRRARGRSSRRRRTSRARRRRRPTSATWRARSRARRARALLWERLGRPAHAARAWLARAGALATIGAVARGGRGGRGGAASRARRRATPAPRPSRAGRRSRRGPPGDARARAWAVAGRRRRCASDARGPRARRRAAARVGAATRSTTRASPPSDDAAGHAARRPRAGSGGARAPPPSSPGAGRRRRRRVLAALVALVDVPAPLCSRGPALDAAARLATERGDGEAARRARARAAGRGARAARGHAARAPRGARGGRVGARIAAIDAGDVDLRAGAGRAARGRSCARSRRATACGRCSSRCSTRWCSGPASSAACCSCARPTDASCRAPRATSRAATSPASSSRSRRPSPGAPSRRATRSSRPTPSRTLGDVHASVHALRLRSVLAVPLVARGETLGVVYLDDRVRKGAFGPRELAWVRVVASQAAHGHRRRARRRAPAPRGAPAPSARAPASRRLLARARGGARRHAHAARARARRRARRAIAYDEIAGRSEPMRELLQPRRPRHGERRPGARRRRERHRQGARRARDARQRPARTRAPS